MLEQAYEQMFYIYYIPETPAESQKSASLDSVWYLWTLLSVWDGGSPRLTYHDLAPKDVDSGQKVDLGYLYFILFVSQENFKASSLEH